MTSPRPEFGVYIHVPFCSRRCDYCAFATWDDKAGQIDGYMAALFAEVQRATEVGMPVASTVFVGGGTPSLVPGELLATVIAAVPKTPDAEVTVECNPDNVTESLLRTYREAGVNRISLGVQSMVPHVLAALGREHDPDNVVAAVEAINSVGIPTFNLDLIYGAHGETLDDWRSTLRSALALKPPHVSAYALTVEAGTPLADDEARHPDDDIRPTSIRSPMLPSRQQVSATTRSRTGHVPATRAGTTGCTGRRPTTADSVVPRIRTPQVVVGGTCVRPSATSTS